MFIIIYYSLPHVIFVFIFVVYEPVFVYALAC